MSLQIRKTTTLSVDKQSLPPIDENTGLLIKVKKLALGKTLEYVIENVFPWFQLHILSFCTDIYISNLFLIQDLATHFKMSVKMMDLKEWYSIHAITVQFT